MNKKTVMVIFLIILFAGLLFYVMFFSPIVVTRPLQDTQCHSSAKCHHPERRKRESTSFPGIKIIKSNHSSIRTKHPSRLPPLSSRETLTRIGDELQFDHSLCPPDSIMASNQWSSTPAHSSCPALFIAGAHKAGSTSLHQYVSKHPDFEGALLNEGPKAGETLQFCPRHIKKLDKSLFPPNYNMTGDSSVCNLVHCEVPKRIFKSCSNFSKIVILLHDPVDRFVSNHLAPVRLSRLSGSTKTTPGISSIIQAEIKKYRDALLSHNMDIPTGFNKPKQWHKLRCLFLPTKSMVFEGLYYVHVLNWLCNYPSENILIVNSEEFYKDTSIVLKEVFQFLGLDPLSDSQRDVITSSIYNKGLKSFTDKESGRKKLKKIYQFFNDRIFKLLHWNETRVAWKNIRYYY